MERVTFEVLSRAMFIILQADEQTLVRTSLRCSRELLRRPSGVGSGRVSRAYEGSKGLGCCVMSSILEYITMNLPCFGCHRHHPAFVFRFSNFVMELPYGEPNYLESRVASTQRR